MDDKITSLAELLEYFPDAVVYGVYEGVDYQIKLSTIMEAGVGLPTNLGYDPETNKITSSTGSAVSLPIAEADVYGLIKLNQIPAPIDISGKEDSENKSFIPTNETSEIKYPNIKAVVDYLVQGWNAVIPAKTTELIDTDLIPLFNTADGGKTKTRTWAQIKTNLLGIFAKKSNQIIVSSSTPISADWDRQTIIVTAPVTLTVPATLTPADFEFNLLVDIGGSVTWAITTPHVWRFGTPLITAEKTFAFFMKRGNNIYLGT